MRATCAADGCSKTVHAHGYCGKHYMCWKRHGDPLIQIRQTPQPGRICLIEDCGQPHHSDGLCSVHAHRNSRHGDPLAGAPLRIIGDDERRFWSKVDRGQTQDCFNWTGGQDGRGYGQFRVGKKLWASHRFAWVLAYGHIPDDLTIDHLCRNPLCQNVSHMELVSTAENTRRGHIGITESEETRKHLREAQRRRRAGLPPVGRRARRVRRAGT